MIWWRQVRFLMNVLHAFSQLFLSETQISLGPPCFEWCVKAFVECVKWWNLNFVCVTGLIKTPSRILKYYFAILSSILQKARNLISSSKEIKCCWLVLEFADLCLTNDLKRRKMHWNREEIVFFIANTCLYGQWYPTFQPSSLEVLSRLGLWAVGNVSSRAGEILLLERWYHTLNLKCWKVG